MRLCYTALAYRRMTAMGQRPCRAVAPAHAGDSEEGFEPMHKRTLAVLLGAMLLLVLVAAGIVLVNRRPATT